MSDWKSDPRLARWKQAVKVWQKTHKADIPIPITPGENEELEEIFPADKRFVLEDNVVVYGDPHFSQRFVVIK